MLEPDVGGWMHSHRGDGCPTPLTLAIRLVLQISLGRAVPLSHLPMLWENGELTRTPMLSLLQGANNR